MRARSPKRAREERQYAKRRAVFLAGPDGEGRRCEMPGECPQTATQVHHRRGRVGALLLDERHWSAMCGPCHLHVTVNPARAYELGIKRTTHRRCRMTAPLRVLSCGLGTQSSALALMSCDGVLPKLDGIIFADTRHEMPETYDYLKLVRAKAEAAGIPFIVASAGDLKAELIGRQGKGMQPNLPVRVLDEDGKLQRVNAYRCSYDFKRRVIEREVKRLCGPRGAWKRTTVEQWIGYSTDEMSRMKRADECRCGHKRFRAKTKKKPAEFIHGREGCTRCACTGFDPWQTNRWPLIEMQMRRGDAQRWITDQGYPEPPRSACYFCPNRGNDHWRDLRENRPNLWASAVEVDEFVRHGMNEMRGEGFVHQSGVPLAEADLRPKYERLQDIGIEPLFTDDVDADCEAGVCFT